MLKNKCLLNIFIKYIDTDIMKNIVKEPIFLSSSLRTHSLKEELTSPLNCN